MAMMDMVYSASLAAKFHPNWIWNDKALRFFWRGRPSKNGKKTRWAATRGQFVIQQHASVMNNYCR